MGTALYMYYLYSSQQPKLTVCLHFKLKTKLKNESQRDKCAINQVNGRDKMKTKISKKLRFLDGNERW